MEDRILSHLADRIEGVVARVGSIGVAVRSGSAQVERMPRDPSRLLRPTTGLVLLPGLLLACGDRTGLLPYAGPAPAGRTAGLDAARPAVDGAGRPPLADAARDAVSATDAEPDQSCGAPDPSSPLVVALDRVQERGMVAAGACAFAVVWLENDGEALPLVARTVRVVDGAWELSPRAIVSANVADDGGIATIGWDGVGFTVVWVDESKLYVRRMGADAALLGPAVASLATGPDAYPVWVAPPSPEGTLPLVLLDDRRMRFSYHAYFLSIAADGTSVVPAVDLTPTAPDVGIGGVIRTASDASALLWEDDGDGASQALRVTPFDDTGRVGMPVTLVPAFDGLSAGGFVTGPGGTYAGALEYRRGPLVLALPGAAAPRRIAGLLGADAPALAETGKGALGVLDVRGPLAAEKSDLWLTVVTGSDVGGTSRLADDEATPYGFALAAGAASFAAYWQTSTGLKLTVRTP